MINMNFNKIGPGKKAPDIVNVIIENSKGSNNKYEIDKETGLIKLDRVLYSAVHFPGDYGFIPSTLSEDGDPTDVLLLVSNPNLPGVWVEARPIAVMKMVDGGEQDNKILCVPDKDPRFKHIENLKDVTPHLLDEIANFFSTYKILQGKKVEVHGWEPAASAKEMIQKSIKAHGKKK
jgi:inorganic pyrophosphatase